MIERLVQLSVAHRVWVLALTLGLGALATVLAMGRLKLDALPDVTSNQVLVLTSAPGFPPEEVERRVTQPIELALAGIPGLEERRSISRFGISSVTAVFDDDVSALTARQQVAERLASVRGAMPAGVGEPELGPHTGGLGEIFHFTLSSPERTTIELRELAVLRVAPLLRRVPGVVEVNDWGGERRSLELEVAPERLAAAGLTLRDLGDAVERSVGAVAGGSARDGEGQVLVRGLARPVEPTELAAIRLPTSKGSVRLGALAEVRERGLPRLGAATKNGSGEVVYVMAQMLRDANALETMGHIHAALPAMRATLPPDVSLEVVYDRSTLVVATLKTVGKNLLEGGLLVALVLFAMLGSVRAGAVVALVIPLAMMGAGLGMATLGVAGNLMSVGALDFGLLVDGAVVMVEHLFHAEHARAGTAGDETPAERRSWMARELGFVARPTLFSGLTILLVYVPVLALTGVDGKMFRPMAIVVVLALATSIVLSLTYVPAAASLLVRLRDVPARPPLLVRLIQRAYVPTLDLAIRAPVVVALLAVAGLVAGGVAAARAGTELVPQLDEGDLVVQTTRAADTPLDGAVQGALALERAARTVPEVRGVVSRVGSPAVATDIMGLEQADVFVGLAPREQYRPGVDKARVIAELEEAVRAVDPEVELSFTQPIQMRFNELLGGSVTDVSVSVYGADLGVLRSLAERVAAAIEGAPGAVDVRVLAPPDVPEIVVKPSLSSAAALELDARDVLDAVQALRIGLPAATTYDGPMPIPIVLRLPGARSAADLGQVLVPNAAGGLVPLSAVASLERRDTPSMVQRHDGERRLMVGFNVRGGDLGTVVNEAQRRVAAALSMPEGYRLEWGGQIASLDAARARLAVVVPVVLLAIAGLMYAAFRRIRPVVLLLAHVPSAVVGGVLALTARSMTLSISAAIGFIALSGIAVMNGMVMLTQVAEYERAGSSASEARLRAALDRARPVLMTALVAALGFVPMMLASGVGSEVQRPLATVVVGGLVTSTFTTLIVMPALYPWLSGKRDTTAPRETR